MFGIGGTELFLIMVFGLLIFGPDRLPQIGRTVGRAMRQFQRAQDDMTRVLKAEMYASDPDKDSSPFKPVGSILDKKTEANEEKAAEAVPAPVKKNIAASLYGVAPAVPESESAADEASVVSDTSVPDAADADEAAAMTPDIESHGEGEGEDA